MFTAVPMRTSLRTRSGRRIAAIMPTLAPSLQPTTWAGPMPSASMNAIVSSAMISYVIGPSTSGMRPCPRRSGLKTRKRSAILGVNPANVFTDAKPPCSMTRASPEPWAS